MDMLAVPAAAARQSASQPAASVAVEIVKPRPASSYGVAGASPAEVALLQVVSTQGLAAPPLGSYQSVPVVKVQSLTVVDAQSLPLSSVCVEEQSSGLDIKGMVMPPHPSTSVRVRGADGSSPLVAVLDHQPSPLSIPVSHAQLPLGSDQGGQQPADGVLQPLVVLDPLSQENIADSVFAPATDHQSYTEQSDGSGGQPPPAVVDISAAAATVSAAAAAASVSAPVAVDPSADVAAVDGDGEDADNDEKPLATRRLKRPVRLRTRGRPRSAAAPADRSPSPLPFTCEHCFEGYADRLRLAAHERRHAGGGRPYACDACQLSFVLPQSLRRHRLRHARTPGRSPSGPSRPGKRRVKTPSRYLDAVWGEVGLRATRAAPPTETVACGVCDEQLTPREVREHLSAPPDADYFRCEECGAVFGQRCQLSRHGCRQPVERRQRRAKRARVARAPAPPPPAEVEAAEDSDADSGEDGSQDSGSDWAAGEAAGDGPAPAETGRLTCDVCQINFVSRRNLLRHRAQHDGGARFSCEVCELSYARLDDLTRHSQTVHRQKRQFRCPRCLRVFTQKRIVQYHLRTHEASDSANAGRRKDASTAGAEAAPDEAKSAAVAAAAADPTVDPPGPGPVRYKCEQCGAGFDTRRRYTRHQQLRHDLECPRFFCEVCNASYARIDELTRHSIHIHRQKKTVPCPRCTRLFTQQRIVDYHVVGHDTKRVYTKMPRPFPCKQCRRSFRTEELLSSHTCRVGQTGSQRCVCDICGRGISCPQALRRHRMLHSDERPAKCDKCGMAFIDDLALSKHVLTHSEEKPFLCDHCGKGFRFKDYLIRHTRFHTGERPYPCSACDKRFATSDTLNRHFLIHTGEKPFVCHVCARPFRQAQQLKTHMKVHQRKEVLLVLGTHETKEGTAENM